jgi:hypothetical protein
MGGLLQLQLTPRPPRRSNPYTRLRQKTKTRVYRVNISCTASAARPIGKLLANDTLGAPQLASDQQVCACRRGDTTISLTWHSPPSSRSAAEPLWLVEVATASDY